MNPRQRATQIRAAILRRPELRYRGVENMVPAEREARVNAMIDVNPYLGFCYIATQVFCHLVPEAVPWCDDSGMHYWAMIGDERWDLTAEQFTAERLERIYARGRATKFKTLCFRAQELLDDAERGTRAA